MHIPTKKYKLKHTDQKIHTKKYTQSKYTQKNTQQKMHTKEYTLKDTH